MKKKLVLATVVAAIMMLGLVGCGVKITNIAVPESAMVEKGESITLSVVYGTDDAPAVTPETAATGESAATDEKVAKAAEKLTIEWTSSDESVATVDETGTVTAVAAGEANVTASVKDADIAASTHIKVVVTPTGVVAPESIDLVTKRTQPKVLASNTACPSVGYALYFIARFSFTTGIDCSPHMQWFDCLSM